MALPNVTVSFDRKQLGTIELAASDGSAKLIGHTGFGEDVARWIHKLGNGYEELAYFLEENEEFPEGTVFAYIRVLQVKATARGGGLGGVMLEMACAALREAGIRYIFLHAAAEEGQEVALERFYHRHGFGGYDVEDANPVMWRDLKRRVK